MLTSVESHPTTKHFGRALGIGVLVQILVVAVTFGVVALTPLGDDGIVGTLSFILGVAVLDSLTLIVELILVAISSSRVRIGSGPGLLLGWLIGFILQLLPILIINLT